MENSQRVHGLAREILRNDAEDGDQAMAMTIKRCFKLPL
jgi:hypothetical protein